MRLIACILFWRPLMFAAILTLPCLASAQSVAVRNPQKNIHRLFLLRSADGKLIGTGDEQAVTQGDLVHSRLTFHFRDGSIDDDDAVFTQDKVFHLLSDHHIQQGPSFPTLVDFALDVPAGTVTWHDWKNGRDQAHIAYISMPGNLANGIMPLMVENFASGSQPMQLSWIAVDWKPLLVTLSVSPSGTASFDPSGTTESATQYTIHPILHGVVSFLAPLVSKQPADLHVWISDQPPPSFLRLTGPFYQDGPVWSVESTGSMY